MIENYHSDYENRPRMLLAYADAGYASECGRYFRRLGWEVQMVGAAASKPALSPMIPPDVVVLDAELLDESGWFDQRQDQHRQPGNPHHSGGRRLDASDSDCARMVAPRNV